MAHFKSASLLTLISGSWIFHLVLSEGTLGPKDITAYLGKNVTLTCQSINKGPVTAVEWTRSDLKTLEYVFFFRDGRSDPTYQHPSFKNRVELPVKQMKNGDLSLTLMDVKKNDNGTYQCRIKADEARRRKRGLIEDEPISIITLKVEESAGMDQQDQKEPDPERPAAVAVPVTLAVIVAVAAAGFLIYRKQRARGRDFIPVQVMI